ncbi:MULTISPECIES: DUF397 domain-containing protein [unclassified Streptomyces]|uniref:DUF397 domain-containing protein n=1 Tax=Streptomyces sp. NBC_00060 TaxID=2975636 RepID=A0AAU2GZW6_9ACTN
MSSTLRWFKSSYSSASGGECVEVAAGPQAVHVRDSKLPEGGPTFEVAPDVWAQFVGWAA